MSLWDRSLLLITSVIIFLVAIWMTWMVYFPTLLEEKLLKGIHIDPIPVIFIALLFSLIALRLFWISIRRSRRGRAGVDHETEIGHVRISVDTLESLAKKAAGRIKGIRELTARVHLDRVSETVQIGFRIVVDGDRPFLELSSELQSTVKKQVESTAGIDVDEVAVNIIQAEKSDRSRIRVN